MRSHMLDITKPIPVYFNTINLRICEYLNVQHMGTPYNFMEPYRNVNSGLISLCPSRFNNHNAENEQFQIKIQ